MMMDTTVDTDGTAFICPECNFSGKSLPELMSHLNDAHGEGLLTEGVHHSLIARYPSDGQQERSTSAHDAVQCSTRETLET